MPSPLAQLSQSGRLLHSEAKVPAGPVLEEERPGSGKPSTQGAPASRRSYRERSRDGVKGRGSESGAEGAGSQSCEVSGARKVAGCADGAQVGTLT